MVRYRQKQKNNIFVALNENVVVDKVTSCLNCLNLVILHKEQQST